MKLLLTNFQQDSNTITEVSSSLRTTADVVVATREHTGAIDSRVKSVYKRLQPKLLVTTENDLSLIQ